MYIKVRKLGALRGEGDKIINISKKAIIQELKNLIEKQMGIEPQQQMLLYKGKQVSIFNGFTLIYL